MKKHWDYLIAFGVGVAACICVVGYIATVAAWGTARDCDQMGKTMLNGKPYECRAAQEKQQ